MCSRQMFGFFTLIISMLFIELVCHGVESESQAQRRLDELSSLQYYEKRGANNSLSQYYKDKVTDNARKYPWILRGWSYENELTKKIDSIFEPSHNFWINAAWNTMEMKGGMIPERHVKKVAGAILELWQNPKKRYNGLNGLQQYVTEKHGERVGGNINIARTKPPMRQQIAVRHKLLKEICLMYDFLEVLLETADKYKATVMPGYTHIRHAQPTTFGHYLLSVYDPVFRSMKTLEDGYHAMSLNELGCGALAGTSWPIDRNLVSKYLGLEGLIENTNDAVAYTDGYVLLTAGVTNILTIISRLGTDLNYWSTLEFDFMDFEIGAGSFMMPQKRSNQGLLGGTGYAAAMVLGDLTEVASMGMRYPHEDMNAWAYHMKHGTLDALKLIEQHVKPLLYFLPGIEVFEDRMLSMARTGYSCATELANQIVRDFDVDYRTAHEIVNKFVTESARKNIPSRKASIEIFNNATKAVIGRQLNLSETKLRKILDPVHFVEVTDSKGGVAPKEVARMIIERQERLAEARARHLARIEKLEKAKTLLLSDLEKLYEK